MAFLVAVVRLLGRFVACRDRNLIKRSRGQEGFFPTTKCIPSARAKCSALDGQRTLSGPTVFALPGRKIRTNFAHEIAKIRGMQARSSVAEQLGRRVAELRLQIGMGQKEVAAEAGTTVKVISQLERGVSIPSVEKLEKIANVLFVQLVDLFDFEYEMNDRRYDLLVQISYMLRGRQAKDLEDVRDMLRLVFEIKRRERPTRRR